MTISKNTCLDCPAKVSGKATRCLACNKVRTLEKNKAAAARYLARKKAGHAPASNPLVPAGGAVTSMSQTEIFLANYDAVKAAVAELSTIPDWKAFTARAAFVQDFANRAENRDLEIDAARARLVMQEHLGMMLIDMEQAGELRRHGHSKVGGSAVEPPPPTLKDLKISKKLSMKSKNYARMNDFDDRLADWQQRQEEEAGPIALKILTARPKTPRKENDAYYSPVSMINEVRARWHPAGTIWEPCCGDGRFADALAAAGRDVVSGDIASGDDFFEIKEAPASALCTNPPFKVFDENGKAINEKNIRGFIDHAFAIGITEMCLIVPERLFACGDGRAQFERHKPAFFAQMDWREDYLGKGGQANMMLAVAIWTSPCAKHCDYEIWSRVNQPN